MRVLVTGSNGFIGGHICDYLTNKGIDVIGTSLKRNNSGKKYPFFQMDITSRYSIESVADSIGIFDAVVHCASFLKNEEFSETLGSINIIGTQNILKLTESISSHKLVLISSCPVIGMPFQHPITENHPTNPESYYHLTKLIQEQLIVYAGRKNLLEGIILRIPSPIGIGMNEATILPVFIKNAVANKPLMLSGRGSRSQNYIYVKDIAQAVYLSLLSRKASGIYNIASENPITNYGLAEMCVSLLNSSSAINFNGSDDPCDNYHWDISIAKAKAELGFSPQIRIEDAILEIARNLREKWQQQ